MDSAAVAIVKRLLELGDSLALRADVRSMLGPATDPEVAEWIRLRAELEAAGGIEARD